MGSKKNILVVAAHPDDEVIGCGGAIAVHVLRGDDAHVLFMSDGVTSRGYDPNHPLPRAEELAFNTEAIERRKKESIAALAVLGVSAGNCIHLGLLDQRLDVYPFLDLVKHVEKVRDILSPTIVYTHFFGDLNLDHRLTAQAVLTAFRPRQETNVIVRLFEVPETTEISGQAGHAVFNPDYLLDISEFWDHKQKALSVYTSESREYPHPRSMRAMRERAAFWGKRAGVAYGEAFMTCYGDSNKRSHEKNKALLTSVKEGGMRLRPAQKTDAAFLFELRNDPEVRRSAFSEKPLVWKEHLTWLENKLASQNTIILIAEVNGEPTGQVRFDIERDGAVVDIALMQRARGRGLGQVLLKQGVDYFMRMNPKVNLVAYVKKENMPSLRCFREAGFKDDGAVVIQGSSCRRMRLTPILFL